MLEVLAASPAPRALAELARELGIPKSSLHGILRTMMARGWVEADPTGSRFGLGVRALQVGSAYLDADSGVGLVAGVLDGLSAAFGETVHLGRLDGAYVVYLAKRESVHRLRLFSAIGRRLPAHTTALGKVLLAERSEAELDQLLPDPLPALTPQTVTARSALAAELATIREQGYAVDREENTEGIACFAVAVPAAAVRAAVAPAPAVPAAVAPAAVPAAVAPAPLSTPGIAEPAPAARRGQASPTDAISISVPIARFAPQTEASIIAALRQAVIQLGAARNLVSQFP